MSELVKRTLSGIVFVACIVGCILWSQWAVMGLLLFVSMMAVDEFHRLVKSHILQRICAGLGVLVLWFLAVCLTYEHPEGDLSALVFPMLMAYLPVMIVALLDEIWNRSEMPLAHWGNMLISQAMIALPLLTMMVLYRLDHLLLLALFVFIWVNDTGAYCVGTLTAKRPQGNHKMAPHVSPKKSWEGLIGGVVFALAAAFVLWECGWFRIFGTGNVSLIMTIIFAVATSLFGTLGDLMESLFKRSIGVKDSGHFLPGHGGVLDRFDSILLAAPVITSYCWLCYFLVPLF